MFEASSGAWPAPHRIPLPQLRMAAVMLSVPMAVRPIAGRRRVAEASMEDPVKPTPATTPPTEV